jgi:hypothetical protein
VGCLPAAAVTCSKAGPDPRRLAGSIPIGAGIAPVGLDLARAGGIHGREEARLALLAVGDDVDTGLGLTADDVATAQRTSRA